MVMPAGACGLSGAGWPAGEQRGEDTGVRCRRTRICGYAWNVPCDVTTVTCPRCETCQPPARISSWTADGPLTGPLPFFPLLGLPPE